MMKTCHLVACQNQVRNQEGIHTGVPGLRPGFAAVRSVPQLPGFSMLVG